MSNGKMTVHSRSPALTSRNHTSPHIFYDISTMMLHPGCLFRQLYLSCISARSQDINLWIALPSSPHLQPSTDAIRSLVAIMVCSSATQNLPKHETNFFVPPPHCSKPSLHEQPPFLLAMLSNNWKKQPRLFGGQKVSICFVICIFVCKKLY